MFHRVRVSEGMRFRLGLECIEDRTVPSAPVASATSLLSLKVTSLTVVNGSLTATGQVDGNRNASFTTQIDIGAMASTTTGGTPSVELTVNPISVVQRQISIESSTIGLDVTPTTGATGSLGSILSNVATQLSAGSSVQTVLAGLSATDAATLTAGITDMVNDSLAQITLRTAVTSAQGKPGKFGTLDLSSSPATLTVDGQTLSVNDGAGGPATLTITAGGAQGHLLDNLFQKLGVVIGSGGTRVENLLLNAITQRIDLIEGIKVG